MVVCESDAKCGLKLTRMKHELEVLFGRQVDLVTGQAIAQSHNWIRWANILKLAKQIDVAVFSRN
jgi:predicted nucleotidyltransferase